MRKLVFTVAAFLALAAAPARSASSLPLPLATPEQEGFSAARLQTMHDALNAYARDGKRSGGITLVARNGRIVDIRAWGFRDLESKLPMEKDTICRIYSMTKTITSVAVLQLMEQGKFNLDEPVEKYIPELKGMRAFDGASAKHPITIRQLLTHTSGLPYWFGDTPLNEIWKKADLGKAPTLRDFVERVAKLPLANQPGEEFHYGVSIDVLGYLVEVVSEMTFDRFVQTRILDPLAMRDTHFFLPKEKQGRAAKVYQLKEGRLVATDDPDYKFPAGGMGLWSTIGDYARFAQMLCNFGQLDGARILGRKTVELMIANHLTPSQMQKKPENERGYGFGLGGSVRLEPGGGQLGTTGDFGWGGAAATYYRVDTKERLVMLLFQQHFGDDEPQSRFHNLVYQALVD